MKPTALALVMMLLACQSLACNGSISQYVPAIVGDDGGLVNVTMTLVPGGGNVFATVHPRTALSTQDSIAQAVSYARSLSTMPGKEACDVLVGFETPVETGQVEGPSAGAALAVMTYALLENKTLRQDAIMTGTIGPDGNVGEVGGLYEKARGAAQKGAKYFITPVENFYEALLLKGMEKEYGITVIQAHNASELIGFMIYNRSIDQAGFGTELRPIPDLPRYDAAGIDGFAPVARHMIGLEKEVAESLEADDAEAAGMRGFFLNEVNRQTKLLDDGYAFSAANEAFLNYIDLSTIVAMVSGDVDLPRKKGEAGRCLSQIKRQGITDRNFEWLIGADLREAWAARKLNATETGGRLVSDEKYVTYNELMYAQAWCSVSKELLAAAPDGGTSLDEGAWKGLAEEKLAVAREMPRSGQDTQFKLETAVDSYDKGRYGAAIYDADYVIVMDGEASDTAGTDAAGEVAGMLNESRTSLWGGIYGSQGAFLHEQGDDRGAYRILLFAKELDRSTRTMVELLPGDGDTAGQAGDGAGQAEGRTREDLLFLLGASILTASLILMFLLLLMLILGCGNNSQGTRTADRAEQKKGRA